MQTNGEKTSMNNSPVTRELETQPVQKSIVPKVQNDSEIMIKEEQGEGIDIETEASNDDVRNNKITAGLINEISTGNDLVNEREMSDNSRNGYINYSREY